MQSEQTRQRRRERKRLEREEKRRSRQAPLGKATISLQALPPMGETLREYAHPILRWVTADHGPEELKAVLAFACTFWNALLDPGEIDEAVPILARTALDKLRMPLTEAHRLSKVLLARRILDFGDDPRIVTQIDVS